MLHAGAWSVPVVVVAVAAPAAAASDQRLTWTWTATSVRSYQAEVYFTVTNPSDLPVDVVFQAPRRQGAIEYYGHGFGTWEVSVDASTIVCATTVPAGGSATTPFLGYFTRTPPASETLVGTLSPAGIPAVPTVVLSFT
ncbi:MAG: hypothetical protein Q7T71_19625 [Herbiconiux sp.]|nr:hypothetical protein [Herbiconiux sp.]